MCKYICELQASGACVRDYFALDVRASQQEGS